MAKIEQILELERLERDIFRGIATETMLPRTFGGQVAGQALVSAVRRSMSTSTSIRCTATSCGRVTR